MIDPLENLPNFGPVIEVLKSFASSKHYQNQYLSSLTDFVFFLEVNLNGVIIGYRVDLTNLCKFVLQDAQLLKTIKEEKNYHQNQEYFENILDCCPGLLRDKLRLIIAADDFQSSIFSSGK